MENEINLKSELERITKLISESKKLEIDNYFVGNYCDALDLTKNWCVAEVIDRTDDKVKVHFEGWSSKFEEVLSINSKRLTHFRKFSRGYTGQKSTAYRLYYFNYEDFLEIKTLIRIIIETNFTCLTDPLEITQILRGKIFTWIDIFMTCPFNKETLSKDKKVNDDNEKLNSLKFAVPEIFILLHDFIDLFILYLNFIKENLYISEIIEKYPELYLSDNKCALFSCFGEFILTIKRIFGKDERTNNFFRLNEIYLLDEVSKHKNSTTSGKKICRPELYKSNIIIFKVQSKIILNFIEEFYCKNGFTLIFDIIFAKYYSVLPKNQQENFPSYSTPIFLIYSICKILEFANNYLDFNMIFSPQITKFKEFIFSRMNQLSNSEIKDTDPKVFENLASLIRNIFSVDGNELTAKIYYEEINLIYAYKCFNSKILEKRIKGISYIDKLVEIVFLKESLCNLAGHGNSTGKKTQNISSNQENIINNEINEDTCCLDSDYLFYWVKEKKLLESILGENIHEEILKRSLNIFILYVKKNSLPLAAYDSICKDLLTRHESIAKEIQNIICEMALYMTQEEKKLIFEKLSQNNFKSYKEDIIIFIKNLTMNCIKIDKGNYKDNLYNQFININLYGIPILWKFFLDEEDNNYVEITYQCLEEIFKTCNLQEEILMKYLILCLENLHSSKSIVQSLKLFKSLMEIMDRIKKDTYDEENILKILNERYSIIELIVTDFQRYYSKVYDEIKIHKKFVNGKDIDSNMIDNLNIIYEGFYPHIKNIEIRLEILIFIYSFSNFRGLKIDIDISHIQRIWDSINRKKNTISNKIDFNHGLIDGDNICNLGDKNILYKFLLNENKSEGDCFNNVLTKMIFERILMDPEKFDTESISLSAFSLYIKYFKQVNLNEEKVIYIHKKLRICDDDLIGYENLWEFLINSKDELVRKECSKFLIYVCLNPRKFEEDICNKLWTKFSNFLMKYMEKLKNLTEFSKLVVLIKHLYLELSSPGYITREDELEKFSNTFPVLFVNSIKNEKKSLQIGQNELVCELREKISFLYSIPLVTLALKLNKRILDYNDDENLFRDVFDSNFYVEIIQVINPLFKFKDFNLKKLVIDNDYIFEILFNYLDIYEECENFKDTLAEIWELLCILPVNIKFEEKIFSLGKKSLDKNENILKNYKSIYQIVYILKIIKIFVDKENLEWIEVFNENKGFIRLTEIIIYISFREELFINNSDLAFGCLIDILNILSKANKVFFIGFNYSLFSLLFSNSEHKNEFIKMILKVITFIFKSSIATDKDTKLNKVQEDFQRKVNREYIHKLFFLKKENIINEIDNYKKDGIQLNQISSSQKELSKTFLLDEINLVEDDEKIHPDILNRWNKETSILENVIKFLSNQFFQPEEIIKNFFDKSGVKILKEYFSLCFIYPRNSKIKFDLNSFLNILFSQSNYNIKKEYISNVYHIIFSVDVCDILCNLKNNHIKSTNCGDYFKIIKLIITNCEENFRLTEKFISENMTSEEHSNFEDFLINISKFIKTNIKNKSILENTENENVIIGFIYLLKNLSQINQKVLTILREEKIFKFLVEYFFTKENYDESNNIIVDRNPVEKNTFSPSAKLKSASYELISCLCYDSLDNQNKIITTLSDYLTLGFWRNKRILDWTIIIKEKKSSTGYSGLKNLGSTCYMNSLIQQLYMIESLRDGILSISDNEHIPKEESLLFQLKSIFASLKLTEMKYVDTKDFCNSLRNYDGRLINIFEQMDIDEYYNLLLEQIEPYLKVTNQKNIFKHHFSGIISNEFKCKVCNNSSSNQDSFLSICLEVKNKKSVMQSLDSYVKEEILEGENAYFCEQCNKKVKAFKRQSIKTLPKILVLVLKRFQFDYNTMSKRKVNDYCEFPNKLNMKHYTQDYLSLENRKLNEDNLTAHIEESELLYDLTGVVIHGGSAESGHYYSIIKDTKNSKWYEFNDNHITNFEIEELPYEAFGGVSNEKSIEKSTNAYVLFYTQTNSFDSTKNDLLENDINNGESKNSYIIQTYIMKKINIDNFQLWVSNILFSKEYFEFMQQFILSLTDENNHIISSNVYNTQSKNLKILSENHSSDKNSENFNKNLNIPLKLFSFSSKVNQYSSMYKNLDILPKHENFKFIIKVFLYNVLRFREKYFIASFVDIIKTYINLNYQNAYWLLEEFSNIEIISEFLIDCPFHEIRKVTAGLICCSMIKYSTSNNKLTGYSKSDITPSESGHKSPLLNFILSILFLITDKKQSICRNFSTLNYIVWKFSLINIETKQFLVDTNLLKYLIKYFKGKYSIIDLSQFPSKENLQNISVNNDGKNNIEEIIDLKIREPMHKELVGKIMINMEKTSALEEYYEKKHIEKNTPAYTDLHLFMTFLEIIFYSDLEYFVKNEANSFSVLLSEEDKKLLDFKDLNFLKFLIKQCKCKQSTFKICELFKSICYENIEITESLGVAIIDLFYLWDFGECEYITKIFKEILLIEDNLQYDRVMINVILLYKI